MEESTGPPFFVLARAEPFAVMLFKSLAAQLEDVSVKDGLVTHYWSAFGNRDSDGDVIERGAYAKTIAERGPAGANRIKFLWQHDVYSPIGRPVEMVEDEKGLRVVTKVSPTTLGSDAMILYEDGVLTEHSVGIDILRRDERENAVVLETRLWEGSVVTWGANPLTPFLGMKGEDPSGISDAAWRRVEGQMAAARKALRRGLTDETAENLEIWLGVHEAQLQELRKTLRKSQDFGGYTVLPPYDPTPGADNSALDAALRRLLNEHAPTDQQTPGLVPTSGDGAPRDETEALTLIINALGG